MRIALIIVSVFMLAGCIEPAQQGQSQEVYNGSIQLITLADGTNCAVFSGYKKGGLSCNWKN